MNYFIRPILGRVRLLLVIAIVTGIGFTIGFRVWWYEGMEAMTKLGFGFFIALIGVPLLGAFSGFCAFKGLSFLADCNSISKTVLLTLEDQESKRIQRAAREMRERLKIGNEARDQGRILVQEAAVAIAAGVKFETIKNFIERAVPRTTLTYEISNLDKFLSAPPLGPSVIVKGMLTLAWKFKTGRKIEHPIELWSRTVMGTDELGPIK